MAARSATRHSSILRLVAESRRWFQVRDQSIFTPTVRIRLSRTLLFHDRQIKDPQIRETFRCMILRAIIGFDRVIWPISHSIRRSEYVDQLASKFVTLSIEVAELR